MSTVAFIDLDDTIVKNGTREELKPGIFKYVRKLTEQWDVYFFSCWAFTPDDQAWLRSQFPKAKGYIRKPFADEYVFIDDKLNIFESDTELYEVYE
jgi:hypothetical protein